MMPAKEPQPTELSEMITDSMNAKGITIKMLAEHLEVTYEHARRLVRGEGVPSSVVLREICRYLGLDFSRANRLVAVVKINKKFGSIPAELSGKNPELAPIERVWGTLTDDQKQDAIAMIIGWARRNKLQQV